ncbi:unnamed protein product, partial [Vitis vinifera]
MIIMEIAPLIFIFEFGFLHYLLDFSPYLNEEEIKLHETFESVNIWGVKANVRDCPYMEKIASCVGKLIFICKSQEDDDSWEVRAFAEDTGNIMGTTWPPRSYTCTFCRREFRSAQALGGHMNVHRRDRARLHQTHPGSNNPTSSSSTNSSSTLIIPTQEFITNGGLCLLYQLPPNPNALFTPTSINSCIALCPSSKPEPSAVSNGDDDNENTSNNYNDSAMEELDLELRLGHRPSPS